MKFELSLLEGKFNNEIVKKQAVNEIINLNKVTVRFGLELNEKQALELVETRTRALCDNSRVEFGGGIINKLIYAFCDSPFIYKQNYEKTINELVEIFYYYKNETLERVSDDELIQFMCDSFNTTCQGSLELLMGRELNHLSRDIKYGKKIKFRYSKYQKELEDE